MEPPHATALTNLPAHVPGFVHRSVTGPVNELPAHALEAACLLDFLLEDGDDEITGVPQFDHLEPDAQIVLLRDVVR